MDNIDQRINNAVIEVYKKSPKVNPFVANVTDGVRMIYLNEFGNISIELLDDLSEDYKAGFRWPFHADLLDNYINKNSWTSNQK